MLTVKSGHILHEHTEAIVNTVNCIGVMGKGVALLVRNEYPDCYEAYRKICQQGLLSPGIMHTWETGKKTPRLIYNFPTKIHWKSNSRKSWIIQGLVDLKRCVRADRVKSITIPALGCGNGGLNWGEIRPLITAAFREMEMDVIILNPMT